MEKTLSELLADDRAAREHYKTYGTGEYQVLEPVTPQWLPKNHLNSILQLYRIKPAPQLRAYTPKEWRMHRDDWFRQKGTTRAFPVTGIDYADASMLIGASWVTANDAAVLYEHFDPATKTTRPCGVVE